MKKVKVIITLLLVFSLSSCGIKVTLKDSKSDVKNITENATQAYSKNTNVSSTNIENVKKQLGTLEKQLASTNDKEVILKCLEDFKENSPLKTSAIYFGNEDGNFCVFPIVQLPNDYDARARSWYKGAKENGDYVSDPYVDFSTNDKMFSVSKAIYKNKDLIGVVGIDLVIENNENAK